MIVSFLVLLLHVDSVVRNTTAVIT